MRRGGFECVLVGGPTEIAPRFEEALSNSVRDRLAGRFEAEVTYASPDDVRQAAVACFEAAERRHEREVLDRLAQGLGRGERAVAGFADVLTMLAQARVETLLFDDRVEPPDPAVLEMAIEDAVAQSAEVLAVRHHPDELTPHGHVAAVLRF
jgi:peptide subunit release factor 1 (eRF1)